MCCHVSCMRHHLYVSCADQQHVVTRWHGMAWPRARGQLYRGVNHTYRKTNIHSCSCTASYPLGAAICIACAEQILILARPGVVVTFIMTVCVLPLFCHMYCLCVLHLLYRS
jgi:hypothetical protein